MSQVLGASVETLLGIAPLRRPEPVAANRLERRVLDIDQLDPKARRQITQMFDTFIEREKLKQRQSAQEA